MCLFFTLGLLFFAGECHLSKPKITPRGDPFLIQVLTFVFTPSCMKKYITILFAIFSLCIGYANTDSLLQVLSFTNEDTSKARLLRNIGWKYMILDLDSSRLFVMHSLALSKSLGDYKGEVLSTLHLALIENRKTRYLKVCF
jgi:hypothetical protein